jgi:hypothetical protein
LRWSEPYCWSLVGEWAVRVLVGWVYKQLANSLLICANRGFGDLLALPLLVAGLYAVFLPTGAKVREVLASRQGQVDPLALARSGS